MPSLSLSLPRACSLLLTLALLPAGAVAGPRPAAAPSHDDTVENLVFTAVPPCRLVDTRFATNPALDGKLAAGEVRTFLLRGETTNYAGQGGAPGGCGIPGLSGGDPQSNLARAVALNLIAVQPDGPGNLRAWPANQPVPPASVVNYASGDPGLNIANGVIVPLCDEVGTSPCAIGDLSVRADIAGAHLVIDVTGYFHPLERPAGNAGDVTAVTAGDGLAGGGTSGDVALAVDFGGSGAATSVSRSDHDHAGQFWSTTASAFTGLSVTNNGNNGFPAYGVRGINTTSDGGAGVYGEFSGTGPSNGSGVEGQSAAQIGRGVVGTATHLTGLNVGVLGQTASTGGTGVSGIASAATGTTFGVRGKAQSPSGAGGFFVNTAGGNLIAAAASDSIVDLEFRVSSTGSVFADGSYNCGGAVSDSAGDLAEAELEPCLKDDSPADFAEMLPAGGPGLEAGDVLAIGPDGALVRSTTPYQTSVLGIYSTRPSYLGNSRFAGHDGYAPLALVGIVPVKASAENGPIAPGDLLVASGTPGHAMRAGDDAPQGSVLGKALAPLAAGTGQLLALVTLQ